jgi:hypothetical protein
MKYYSKFLFYTMILAIITVYSSCKGDEGKLPNISFKSGSGYTSANATVTAGSPVKIGITASKAETKDVLKTFNISKSVNGGANLTVSTMNLTSAQEDNFDYDYNFNADSAGTTVKYIFTITNRDGLLNSVNLTVTSN